MFTKGTIKDFRGTLFWLYTARVPWVGPLQTLTFASTGLWNHSSGNTWSWLESRNKGHKSYLRSRAHFQEINPKWTVVPLGAPEEEMWDLIGTCVGSASHWQQHLSAKDVDQALPIQCVDSSPAQELENFSCILWWSWPRAACRSPYFTPELSICKFSATTSSF